MELGHGSLGVPEGGGVYGGHHDGPVGGGAGQLEAGAQPGGGVHEHEIEAVLGVVYQGAEPFRVEAVRVHRSGEEIKALDLRLGHGGGGQGAAVAHHVGKIHQCPVGHTQHQVQVAQPDVQVDAQHPAAQGGQAGGGPSGKGGFPRAAFAGGNHNGGAHGRPPSCDMKIITQI